MTERKDGGPLRVKVKCTFFIEFDFPREYEDSLFFQIEENSCPGTGFVWGTPRQVIEKHDKNSTCWACALHGENKIVEINGEKISEGEK